MAHTEHSAAAHEHHDHKPHGFWNRWLTTTNHKDIGTLYLVFSCIMFFVGGTMAMLIRAELFKPGLRRVQIRRRRSAAAAWARSASGPSRR